MSKLDTFELQVRDNHAELANLTRVLEQKYTRLVGVLPHLDKQIFDKAVTLQTELVHTMFYLASTAASESSPEILQDTVWQSFAPTGEESASSLFFQLPLDVRISMLEQTYRYYAHLCFIPKFEHIEDAQIKTTMISFTKAFLENGTESLTKEQSNTVKQFIDLAFSSFDRAGKNQQIDAILEKWIIDLLPSIKGQPEFRQNKDEVLRLISFAAYYIADNPADSFDVSWSNLMNHKNLTPHMAALLENGAQHVAKYPELLERLKKDFDRLRTVLMNQFFGAQALENHINAAAYTHIREVVGTYAPETGARYVLRSPFYDALKNIVIEEVGLQDMLLSLQDLDIISRIRQLGSTQSVESNIVKPLLALCTYFELYDEDLLVELTRNQHPGKLSRISSVIGTYIRNTVEETHG